ncbi:hypothetical protein [Cellulomonas citrea]|uniref:hypothetical protein n=1 Tax=Cellulomonas citrea TaxID=1909423 RepID=UPI0013587F81|nr:hypothetical protein [Cellulomonas citrea]
MTGRSGERRRRLLLLVRPWHVFVLVAALTAGSGLVLLHGQERLVVGRVRVVLLPPLGASPNALVESTSSLLASAGVITRTVSGFPEWATADPGVTLASQGVLAGYQIRQPDQGSQWVHEFNDTALDVQSVGRTQVEAAQQMSAGLDYLSRNITRLEDDWGVQANQRLRISLSPSLPVYETQKGSRVRLLGAVTALGGAVGAGALTALTGWRRRIGVPL